MQEFAKEFDIVCLCETMLDRADEYNVIDAFEGFIPRFKHRTEYKRKSGGIATLFKATVIDFIHDIEIHDLEIAQFFKIDKGLCGMEFILGTVYIPPEGSEYLKGDEFESLMDTLFVLNANHDLPFCLVGDFNARTGRMEDMIIFDHHVAEEAGLSQIENDMFVNIDSLEQQGIRTKRVNSDSKCNKSGHKIIDICKCTGMHIANGRVGKDKHIGKLTCMDNEGNPASAVDYALLSTSLFSKVINFEIDDFDELFSDKHCPLILTLRNSESNTKFANNPTNCQYSPELNPESTGSMHPNGDRPNNIKVSWKPENRQAFFEGFDTDAINSLMLRIDTSNREAMSKSDMDGMASEICKLFFDSGFQADMIANKPASDNTTPGNTQGKTKHKSKPRQPWFNNDCKITRSQYFKAKRRNKKVRSTDSREALRKHSKEYKKATRKAFKDFNRNLKKKLRNLRTSDPKTYWEILNGAKSKINKVAIEVFLEHFKKLNTANSSSTDPHTHDQAPTSLENSDLDYYFTEDEVQKVATHLRNGKSSGIDQVINEFIKFCPPVMISLIVQFLNLILDTGIIPENWTIGIIIPIYKKKGSMDDPDNYRGITLLSCIGKLFTALINKRLYQFLEVNNLLGEEQAGFREGYSTLDHIFVLNSLIEMYLGKGRRIYAAFVDYRKAFDSIDRTALWSKLIQQGIGGKILCIIQNMYSEAKSCLRVNNQISEFFQSHRGVRQGENLSPLLFSIYLNDLEECIQSFSKGLEIESIIDDVRLHINLYVLLYADDTIILSETEEDLQCSLDTLHDYCCKWNLEVNTAKTKIVIFSKGRVTKYTPWVLGDEVLEVQDDYTYLGTTFNYNGNYDKAIAKQVTQAKRAMYSMVGKARKLGLPIDIQLHLFDTLILPILLYGCEVWGSSKLAMIKTVQIGFYKQLLRLNKSTASCIVHGEIGTTDIEYIVKGRMLNFWARIVQGKQSKISHLVYNILLSQYESGEFKSVWLSEIHSNLNSLGLTNIWIQQNPVDILWFKHTIKQLINDSVHQNWRSALEDSGWCRCYKVMKTELKLEPYLTILKPKHAIPLSRFRASNHRLPIVTGRFEGKSVSNRTCELCRQNQIGHELHYLFSCPFFKEDRENYLHSSYLTDINDAKIKMLFQSECYTELKDLSKFVSIIMTKYQDV
jgi:hypothetical protein